MMFRHLILLLIIACLITAFIGAPGTFDDYAFVEWGKALNQQGPFAGYGPLGHVTELDYPPLGVALMWLSLRLGHAFGWPDQISFKAHLALFTIAGTAAAFARRRVLEDALVLLLIVTPFGLLLGYTDVAYLPFLLVALYAAQAERFAVAGFALAFAALLKWQPIILAPLLLIAAARHARTPRQFIATLVPTIILVMLVLALFGPAAVWHAFATATHDSYLGGQGVNLAWLLSYLFELRHLGGLALRPNGAIAILQVPSPVPAVGAAMIALRIAFYAAFIAALGIYAAGRKTPQTFLAAALACSVAQFTWNTGVHENHFFVSMIIAFVAWQARVLDHFTFAAIAAIALLNILLFYGGGDGFNFSALAGIDPTAFLALAELLVYGLVVNLQCRLCLGRATA